MRNHKTRSTLLIISDADSGSGNSGSGKWDISYSSWTTLCRSLSQLGGSVSTLGESRRWTSYSQGEDVSRSNMKRRLF